jgi:hypothetical protein
MYKKYICTKVQKPFEMYKKYQNEASQSWLLNLA